jgi:hypothetical protein
LPLQGQKEESPVAVKRIQTEEVLSRFLGTLDLAQDHYLIEAGGKPIVGLVPPWELENPDESRQALLGMLEVVWARTRDIPEGVLERDMEETVQAVRTRRRRPA